MILVNQNDYPTVTMGQSGVSIKKAGCVTSDISMGSSFFGIFKDVKWLAKNLKYTIQGLLLWPSVSVLGMKFIWRGYPHNFKQAEVDEALKNPKKICLLNVNGGAHWVLGIYRVPFTTKYWVADPLTGSRKFYSGVIGYSILGI